MRGKNPSGLVECVQEKVMVGIGEAFGGTVANAATGAAAALIEPIANRLLKKGEEEVDAEKLVLKLKLQQLEAQMNQGSNGSTSSNGCCPPTQLGKRRSQPKWKMTKPTIGSEELLSYCCRAARAARLYSSPP